MEGEYSLPAPDDHFSPPTEQTVKRESTEYEGPPSNQMSPEMIHCQIKRETLTDNNPTSVNPSACEVKTPTFDLNKRLSAIEDIRQDNSLAADLLRIEAILADNLIRLDFGSKVTHVYNPVDYAYKPHIEYYRVYCKASADIIMIGMNPGPFGMAQTGVGLIFLLHSFG